ILAMGQRRPRLVLAPKPFSARIITQLRHGGIAENERRFIGHRSADYSDGGAKSNTLSARASTPLVPPNVGGALISRPEKGGRPGRPDSAERKRILDEIRVGHESDSDEHRLPKIQALAEDEADKADAAEDQ